MVEGNVNTNTDGMSNLDGLVDEKDLEGLGGSTGTQSQQGQNNAQNQGDNNSQVETDEEKRIKAEKVASDAKASVILEEARKLGLPDNATEQQIQEAKNKASGTNQSKIVEIDGKEYNLDKDGNALTLDGSAIFKTKAEIDTMIAAQDGGNQGSETTAIEDFIKLAGIHPTDDEGKPKVYEDSIEGVLQVASDLGDLKARKTFEAILASNPDFKKYYEYLNRGGNPVDYHKQTASSWKAVKFDPKNSDMLTNAVVANLVRTGMTEEKAKLTAKLYADTNQLEEMGKDSYKSLVGLEDKREADEKAAYEAREKKEEADLDIHWKQTQQTIKKGNIGNIVIPESEKDGFFKYLAAPVDKERNSQSFLENETLTTEQWLQLEYLKYKKFDLSKLVTSLANTKRAEGLKSRFATKQTGVGDGLGVNQNKFQKNNINLDDITIESVQTGKR